ncbi:MAG: 2-amino-4-hydroxy-6-hydroxymethyldihydropteridine diphosphokinase [Pseudomonadota bacterium]
MTWVTLSIGSNQAARENFASCLDMLLLQFRDLALSSVYESTSDDNCGRCYLNMAVGFETDLPLTELATLLKKIEDKHGRARPPAPCDDVTLDIDLLTYGDKSGTFNGVVVPHPDIVLKAYVLWPLSQVAGKRKHPVLKQSFAELYSTHKDQLDKSQRIKPVAFEWHGRILSAP